MVGFYWGNKPPADSHKRHVIRALQGDWGSKEQLVELNVPTLKSVLEAAQSQEDEGLCQIVQLIIDDKVATREEKNREQAVRGMHT